MCIHFTPQEREISPIEAIIHHLNFCWILLLFVPPSLRWMGGGFISKPDLKLIWTSIQAYIKVESFSPSKHTKWKLTIFQCGRRNDIVSKIGILRRFHLFLFYCSNTKEGPDEINALIFLFSSPFFLHVGLLLALAIQAWLISLFPPYILSISHVFLACLIFSTVPGGFRSRICLHLH